MADSLLEKRLKQKEAATSKTVARVEAGDIDVSSEDDVAIMDRITDKVTELNRGKIIGNLNDPKFQEEIRQTIDALLDRERDVVGNPTRKTALAKAIYESLIGLGPIEKYMEDPQVTDIVVHRYDHICIEKGGKIERVAATFRDEEHLRRVIERITQASGRAFNQAQAMVDTRLPDGSRVNATRPPVSPDGATLTIRKFKKEKLTDKDYLRFGTANQEMLEFLKAAVRGRLNILVSGGTGSGKTTLLNMLSNYIPDSELIVTVEDACELKLNQPNVRRLEAQPGTPEGLGVVTIRDLVRNCLRMRPDRIIVGEIRDGAIVDMFSAMSTGHDGSLSTVHANSPENLIEARLPILFGMCEDMTFSDDAQKRQIVESVDLIVQIARLRDGTRKITNITQVQGYGETLREKVKNPNVTINPHKIYLADIFRYVQTGQDENGKLIGEFQATGIVPKVLINKMRVHGVDVNPDWFKKPEQE